MTNSRDAKLLRTESHRERISQGIVAGIDAYMDKVAGDAMFGLFKDLFLRVIRSQMALGAVLWLSGSPGREIVA